jgi:L-ribulose-5-phosphate 4-epimerase
MTRDEKGYIQFHCDWTAAGPPEGPLVLALANWRDRLYRLGLIGVYPDGVGFGNVSGRRSGGGFVISGTATGGVSSLGPEHFAEVTGYDIAANTLACRGPVRASSESLSHAGVYEADPTAGAVFHVHHLGLWKHFYGRLPTTVPTAEAGTPEMAWAIAKLLADPSVRARGVFVMGGHREGLMAFGPTPDAAGQRIVEVFEAGTGRA